jgi:hypothetical protein
MYDSGDRWERKGCKGGRWSEHAWSIRCTEGCVVDTAQYIHRLDDSGADVKDPVSSIHYVVPSV